MSRLGTKLLGWAGVLSLLAAISCADTKSSPRPPTVSSSKKLGGRTGGNDQPEKKKEMTEEAAMAFLTEQCGSCHAPGAPMAITWEMPETADLSAGTLAKMDTMGVAYQTMVNRFNDAPAGQQPTAMPPTLADGKREELGLFLDWMRLNIPTAVAGAEAVFGGASQFGSTIAINLTYECTQVTKTRDFAFRLFNRAFGRDPRPEEVSKYVPAGELDQPVTEERRAALAALIRDPALKNDFNKYALRQFADRLANVGSINAAPTFGLSAAAATDIKQEFYQQLLKYIETTSYKDILLMPKVQVTANTAPLYNMDSVRNPGKGTACATPAAGTWAECDLSPKRGNFFGTIAYLNSAPSSMIESNNNYKRGGNIFAVLAGQLLMAQTNGPKGMKSDPVPTCVTTKDMRMVADDPKKLDGSRAPRGAVAVPKSGAICQGCHLYKALNIASFVFRPFDQNGLMFPPTAFDAPANNQNNNPYRATVVTATSPGILIGDSLDGSATQVKEADLKMLYAENDSIGAQCITDRAGNKLADVNNIGDLTKHLIGDGKVLVNGLSRYMPSVLFNQATTNQEIVAAVASAYTKGEGKLLPVFEAFFKTQTFACATASEN